MAIRQFTDETDEAILARILDSISGDVDKRQGSVAYDLTAPASLELAQFYVKLDDTLGNAFLSEDMPSELLDIAANDFGITRKSAVPATGDVTLTGPIGQFVPSASLVRTDEGIYFTTLVDVTLTQGSAIVGVQAVEPGTLGNVAPGKIDTMVGNLSGVVSVSNTEEFTSGVDVEADSALLSRIYDKVRKPAMSGNVYHYEQWAREVAGVGAARAYPIWNGPGTVKVVLLGDNKRAPAQAVIDAAFAHINAERPIGPGDGLTVVGATEVPINISANLTLASDADLTQVQADIEAAVHAYLEALAFADSLVRYTRIASILLDVSRIIDYADLTINGGTANVQVSDEQVAVMGTVTLNAV